MTQLVFSAKAEQAYQLLLSKYPQAKSALLPVLWLAQQEFDVLTQDVQRYVAGRLGLSLAYVESVVSFYTLYKTRRRGKHHIQVCRNISCVLNGFEQLEQIIKEELALEPDEVLADGSISYTWVECLGACGSAPVIQVNEDAYIERVKPEDLRQMIRSMRGRDGKDS